jgi:hypothetical protein
MKTGDKRLDVAQALKLTIILANIARLCKIKAHRISNDFSTNVWKALECSFA